MNAIHDLTSFAAVIESHTINMLLEVSLTDTVGQPLLFNRRDWGGINREVFMILVGQWERLDHIGDPNSGSEGLGEGIEINDFFASIDTL